MLNGALSFISIVLFSGPLTLGNAYFSLAISRDTNPKLDDAFKGFNSFGTALGTFLLVALFSFLWSLLFVIPGIIAGLAYAMTFYIMADNPTIGAMEAIDESKRMMDGHKWKLFRMQLRFVGLGSPVYSPYSSASFGWFLSCTFVWQNSTMISMDMKKKKKMSQTRSWSRNILKERGLVYY